MFSKNKKNKESKYSNIQMVGTLILYDIDTQKKEIPSQRHFFKNIDIFFNNKSIIK